MSKKKAIVFLNGEFRAKKELKALDLSGYFTVCADGALNYLKGVLTPHFIVGDFDSLDERVLKSGFSGVKTIKYPKEKNLTDGFLALECAVENGAEEVIIFGAFGKRIDHEYHNYELLPYAASMGVKAVLKDESFDVFYISKDTKALAGSAACGAFTFNPEKGKVVSIVAFSENAHILDTKGLYYPCRGLTLKKTAGALENHVCGISNIACGGLAEIVIESGAALVFVEK